MADPDRWRLQIPRPTNDVLLVAKVGYRWPLWRERIFGRLAVVRPADAVYGPVVNWLGPKGNRWKLLGVAFYTGKQRPGLSWVWPVWLVRDAGEPK